MSQASRKFIQDNAVSGAKIRLDSNEMFRARNAANNADVNLFKLTSADKLELQALPEAQSALPIPSSPKQFATIEYVLNYIAGKGDAKDSVSLLADSNIPLTGSTPLTIDGVTVTDQMRLGLVGQTAGAENGIYVITITGPTYTLARSSDASLPGSISEGMYFFATQGTVYAGYESLLTTPDPIVIGTTALVFAKYATTAAQVAGDMLSKSGNTWSIDLASLGGLVSTNPGNIAGQLKVLVDQAALEKDKTTRLDPSTGAVSAKKAKKEQFVLSATDITNQYLDLQNVAGQDSVDLSIAGACAQFETTDFTVNYTGGTSSKTRVTFAGGLASAGVSALAAGDVVEIDYLAF